MLRRDEFLDSLSSYNSTEEIESQLIALEKIVDANLKDYKNVIKFINSNTSGIVSGNIEEVNYVYPTDITHRSLNITGTENINIANLTYAIWDSDILDSNANDASLTPYDDKTIAQGVFNGKIRILLPENTNKYVAYQLARKYMQVDKFDDNGNPIVGFWSRIVKPNDSSNNPTTGDANMNTVKVFYEISTNSVYMEFKLF